MCIRDSIHPDAIVLAGSYSANEHFPIWNVESKNGKYYVYLQQNTGPLARLGYNAASNKTALLSGLFGAGRLLRVVDQAGQIQFGVIESVDTGTSPQILLSQAPTLHF